MESIIIESKNIGPTSAEADHDEVINLWSHVEDYFAKNVITINNSFQLKISIDAEDIKNRLDDLKPENCSAYLKKIFDVRKDLPSAEIFDADPFHGKLVIGLPTAIFKDVREKRNFAIRFIETLFFSMNIAARDGCNLYSFSLSDCGDASHENHSLSSHVIENAWHRSRTDNWPRIEELDFGKVWKWLERQNALNYVLAETATTKAIAVLLRCSYKGDVEATDLVQISQILENLLLTKEEPKARGLKRKIPAVLGAIPENDRSWISGFYKLRSDIVHGDYPIFRPRYNEVDADFERVSPHYWEIVRAFDKGVSVVIALLQDLIKNDSSSYTFEETITYRRLV